MGRRRARELFPSVIVINGGWRLTCYTCYIKTEGERGYMKTGGGEATLYVFHCFTVTSVTHLSINTPCVELSMLGYGHMFLACVCVCVSSINGLSRKSDKWNFELQNREMQLVWRPRQRRIWRRDCVGVGRVSGWSPDRATIYACKPIANCDQKNEKLEDMACKTT